MKTIKWACFSIRNSAGVYFKLHFKLQLHQQRLKKNKTNNNKKNLKKVFQAVSPIRSWIVRAVRGEDPRPPYNLWRNQF